MKRILFALTVMAATLVSCSKDNGGNGDGSEKLVREITYRSTRGTTESETNMIHRTVLQG